MYIQKTCAEWLRRAAEDEKEYDISAGRDPHLPPRGRTSSSEESDINGASITYCERSLTLKLEGAIPPSNPVDEAPKPVGCIAPRLRLQFRVAQTLKREGFTFEPAYKYEALPGESESVDFFACARLPSPAHAISKLLLVIQCKSFTTFNRLLFAPQVGGDDEGQAETVLWAFQPFSKKRLLRRCSFAPKLDLAFGGIELNTEGKESSDLERDVAKLRYAVARCLHESIQAQALQHTSKWIISAGLLITGSPIHLLRPDRLGSDSYLHGDLSEIADEVPFITFHSSYDPSFQNYVLKVVAEPPGYRQVPVAASQHDATKLERHAIARSLRPDSRSGVRKLFTHFVVCNYKRVGEFVSALKDSVAHCSG